MKVVAAMPEHGIFEVNEIGVSRIFPATNEIVRSVGSPYKVVNFFQSALTSVLIKFAIALASAGSAGAPGQVTVTMSITRVSTAIAGESPTEVIAHITAAISAVRLLIDFT
jgi:hypothetical protein